MAKKDKQKDTLLQAPKGMRDILPEEYHFYQNFFEKAEEIANYYGFQPIQTPHLEKIDLFTAAVGEATDIVEKQMYTLKTRGGDRLVLRPEGTAPVLRTYLKHGMYTWPQPVMLWYKGSFFRHENPQAGRFREFQSFGLEILGEENSIADATIIKVATTILEELGLTQYIVHINSIGDKECRGVYRKELSNYYRRKINHLCKDCRRRLKENPLRLLDCKEESCQELKKEAPQMINFLCPNCKIHFKEVLEILDTLNIPYLLDHYLVRGLDYYSRTVFEVYSVSSDVNGKKEREKEEKIEMPENSFLTTGFALLGGGRYDYLSKILSNKDVPAVGVGMGAERIIMALTEKNLLRHKSRAPKVFFIQIGALAKRKSLLLTEMFRKAGIPLAQSVTKDSFKSQLKIAARLGASLILILGQKEALEETVIARDLGLGGQDIVPFSKIVEFVKNKLKEKKHG
jgi:histidyl-tRNA synthetase